MLVDKSLEFSIVEVVSCKLCFFAQKVNNNPVIVMR